MERARLRQSHERTVHSYSVWSQWTVSARPQQGTVKYDYCTVLAAVPRTGRGRRQYPRRLGPSGQQHEERQCHAWDRNTHFLPGALVDS